MESTTQPSEDPRFDDAFAVTEEDKLKLALDRANIPPLYADATWETWELTTQQHLVGASRGHGKTNYAKLATRLNALKEWQGDPGVVFLTGPPGCGKTHLAVATVQRWIRARKKGALFLVTGEFLSDMKAGFKTGANEGVMNQVKHAALLALDDVGSEMATDWVRDSLYMLINYRINHLRPTIVTSNLTPSEIAETYHSRLASRLVSGLVVDMSLLKDYRLRKGTPNGAV